MKFLTDNDTVHLYWGSTFIWSRIHPSESFDLWMDDIRAIIDGSMTWELDDMYPYDIGDC